jgi:hypothetical protein
MKGPIALQGTLQLLEELRGGDVDAASLYSFFDQRSCTRGLLVSIAIETGEPGA